MTRNAKRTNSPPTIFYLRETSQEFVATRVTSRRMQLRCFGEAVGIHPGIVVGRLRHTKIIEHDCLANLIDRVTHEDIAAAIKGKG